MLYTLIATVVFLNTPNVPPFINAMVYSSYEDCEKALDTLIDNLIKDDPEVKPKIEIDPMTKQRVIVTRLKNGQIDNIGFTKCVKSGSELK